MEKDALKKGMPLGDGKWFQLKNNGCEKFLLCHVNLDPVMGFICVFGLEELRTLRDITNAIEAGELNYE